jgi:hypothetical protein
MEMSKFSGPKDPGYKKVSKELVAILDQITSQQHDTSTHDYEEHSLDSHLNPVTTNPRKDMHDKSDVVQGGTCQTFTASGNAVSGTFAGQNTTITTGESASEPSMMFAC